MSGRDVGLAGQVVLSRLRPSQGDLIREVIELGNIHRQTVGQLPYAVYTDAAAKGTLLAATLDGVVVGYALYRLSATQVSLLQLCVTPDKQRHGIARLLVEDMKRSHADLLGIRAKCRYSYGIGPLWLRLGFKQRAEVPGRSKGKAPLIIWWHDHGHPSLLTRHTEPTLRATVDLEILRQMTDPDDPDGLDARALTDDQMYGQLELLITPSVRLGLASISDDLMRKRCTDGTNNLADVEPPAGETDRIVRELRALLSEQRRSPERTWDEEALIDGLAQSIAAGITVTVTRATNHRFFDAVAARYGLRALQPVDVLLHLDELTRAQDYRPASLLGGDLEKRRFGAPTTIMLLPFVRSQDGEDVEGLARYVRMLGTSGSERYVIAEPDGPILLMLATTARNEVLEVPLLRVRPGANASTLARLALFAFRDDCRRAGRSIVKITDPYPSPVFEDAWHHEGFQAGNDGHPFALVLDVQGSTEEVLGHAAEMLRTLVREPLPSLGSGMSKRAAAEIERAWWPAKLTDSGLESYIVSIEARWATQLFGVPQSLTGRPAELAFSREHVYYRSPVPKSVPAPSRILWYVKQDPRKSAAYPPCVIGCSLVEASDVGPVEELYEAHQHLGVWSLTEVRGVAKTGLAQVIRFTNTELFGHPIGLTRLQQLGREYRITIIPQAPRRVPAEVFYRLLTEGQQGS